MILLRANAGLKVVFVKLINTMGRNFTWNDIFIIRNNNLVLAGSDSVMIFDFGNKVISSNMAEVNLNEDSIVQIPKNELLENVLNMTLYAFGKWGKIKGLTVERDYPQINALFGNILKEIEVEPLLTADNLKLYRNGIQITYEDMIQIILEQQEKRDQKKDEQSEEGLPEEGTKEKGKYDIGLWHKIVWKSEYFTFEKEELSEEEKIKGRIGNNFYKVGCKCPICDNKLSMVIYPEGEELLIETDEKGVYLARAYTCQACHRLFTPKPHLLLADGSVYTLDFEEDNEAYEDYLEIIGKQGERTYNCNFNQYEAEYRQNKSKNETQLDEICEELDALSDQEVDSLKEKMDAGFYPSQSLERCSGTVVKEIKKRERHAKVIKEKEDKHKEKDGQPKPEADEHGRPFMLSRYNEQEYGTEIEERPKQERINSGEKSSGNIIEEQKGVRYDYDSRNNPEDASSTNQARNTSVTSEGEGIDPAPNPDQESALKEKAEGCKDKEYHAIVRVMEEIKKEELSNEAREILLQPLEKLLKLRGRKELDSIRREIPEHITKKQYLLFKERIAQYKGIDHSADLDYLELRRGEAEKQEIAAFIKKANARDRSSYMQLYQNLKKEGFEEKNTAPFLEDIHDKIYAMDEAVIKKICGDPAELTYGRGLKAYDEIAKSDLLPELKTNSLGMIDKRLTKIKMNECEQLVGKLSKELGKLMSQPVRVHFYDVRRGIRNDPEEESAVIRNALNTYATGRGKYEFPIVICDASVKGNGKRGFVLTPDHIFYNTLVESGTLDVMSVEKITVRGRKKIVADTERSGRIKLANSLKLSDIRGFTELLNEFVSYLKEKPESRDIAYIAKEKHSVKCCYRCGHVYQGDNVCPKCGAKFNE